MLHEDYGHYSYSDHKQGSATAEYRHYVDEAVQLAEKCRKREYIGKSRSYKFYQSGELIKHREDDREYMGRTLYLGSLKSDVYFCIYEKDYEQYVKLGTPLEEADIINRFLHFSASSGISKMPVWSLIARSIRFITPPSTSASMRKSYQLLCCASR